MFLHLCSSVFVCFCVFLNFYIGEFVLFIMFLCVVFLFLCECLSLGVCSFCDCECFFISVCVGL